MSLIFAGSTTPYLYFSTGSEIRKIDLRLGFNYSVVVDNLRGNWVMDYDLRNNKLYYSGITTDMITRCSLDGSACEDVVRTRISSISGKNQFTLRVWSRKEEFCFPKSRGISQDAVKGNVSTQGSVRVYMAGLSGFDIHGSNLHPRAGCQLAKLLDVVGHPTSTLSQLLTKHSFISVCDGF